MIPVIITFMLKNNHWADRESINQTRPHTQNLLTELTDLCTKHPEIFSRESRKHLATALHKSFIQPENNYNLPDNYGLKEKDANFIVKKAINAYLDNMTPIMKALNITDAAERHLFFSKHYLSRKQKGVDLFNFFGTWSIDDNREMTNILLDDISEGKIARYFDKKFAQNYPLYWTLGIIFFSNSNIQQFINDF